MLGVVYGPMNNMLLALLLGIGIDDMFVLAEAYENVEIRLRKEAKKLMEQRGNNNKDANADATGGVANVGRLLNPAAMMPVSQLMGLATKEAGLAITVTSLTDFAAFAIGSSTVSFQIMFKRQS